MKAKEIFIATESNPNMKDLDGQVYLKTTLFENEKDCDDFVDTLIENYINLYVECGNDYPEMLFTFNDKENNFYVDRFTGYLEWNNIVVKKSIRTF